MPVRITQLPVETSVAPDNAKVRVTQLPVEVSVAPDTGKVRITQLILETSITIGSRRRPRVFVVT